MIADRGVTNLRRTWIAIGLGLCGDRRASTEGLCEVRWNDVKCGEVKGREVNS